MREIKMKLTKHRIIGYAAIVTVALLMATIGLATSSWADWCNGACY